MQSNTSAVPSTGIQIRPIEPCRTKPVEVVKAGLVRLPSVCSQRFLVEIADVCVGKPFMVRVPELLDIPLLNILKMARMSLRPAQMAVRLGHISS